MKRLGILFMVLVIALAGIGAAFAAWTDTITIEGTVNTGSVELEVVKYSGTEAWKVDNHGIVVNSGWLPLAPPPSPVGTKPIGTAIAREGTGSEADVVFEFDNIFPCVDFCADVLIHYTGTVPAIVTADIDTDDAWLAELWNEGHAKAVAYWSDEDGTQGRVIEGPIQMHNCDYVIVKLCVKLPQDNNLQGLEGSFSGWIGAIQWNKADEMDQYFPPR